MRSRRNIELALLLAAAPAVLLLFALVQGNVRHALGLIDLAVPTGLLIAFMAAHIATRFLAPGADPVLLPVTFFLSGMGLATITRLDAKLGAAQTLWVFAGVAVMVAVLIAVPSLERIGRYKYTIILAGIGLLLLPALIGVEVNGAKLWLRFAGFSFQPAEVAKVLIVLFLAAYLAENRAVLSVSTRRIAGIWLPPAKHLGPLLLMWTVSLIVLVAEKDLGSSLLFFGVFLVMLYTATGRPGYVIVGVVLFAMGAVAAYMMFGHVQTRVDIWLHPFADAAGKGYQLVQSLFAFAAGGMTGVGVGKGLPTRIPFVQTDFIFAAIGEELGLLGAAGIIIAYLVLALRGLATAARARSDMAALTATGIVATLSLQTFVIIGGVTRLIPLTGITLPFISYGGSSILTNFLLLGLLLRAGDAGTGHETEIITSGTTGVLGRFALSRRLTAVGWSVVILLVALVGNLTYLQVFDAKALAANPANTRLLAEQLRQQRGAITTQDGTVLAESIPSGSIYKRSYPAGSLAAHVVGYYSSRYGRVGIESTMNDALAGKRSFTSVQELIDSAAGIPVAGNDVRLTIDSDVQKAAQKALVGHRGACVVLDPTTGAVLALASSPTYDPSSVDIDWSTLSSGDSAPLLDRAVQALYPPGSTFKVVTLTGALGAGIATPSTTYPGPASLTIGNAPVTNYGSVGYGTVTLTKATYSSINTVYGQLAVDLGADKLVSQAERFGFGDPLPIELRSKTSLMPKPDEMTTWETAWAGVGQPVGEHASPAGPQTTVLQMAMVAAGIANKGVVMRPYIVDAITDQAGSVITQTRPRSFMRATDAATAQTVTDLMTGVVAVGSGQKAAISGVKVAGKTGTAEAGKSVETHAWFIAFAPADNPTVAMAIVLENSGTGGGVAAPAARDVLKVALAR